MSGHKSRGKCPDDADYDRPPPIVFSGRDANFRLFFFRALGAYPPTGWAPNPDPGPTSVSARTQNVRIGTDLSDNSGPNLSGR